MWWTDERRQELRRLAEVELLTVGQVAKKMHTSYGAVSGMSRRLKVRWAGSREYNGLRWSSERLGRLRQMINDGATLRAMMSEMKVGSESIKQAIRRNNLPRLPGMRAAPQRVVTSEQRDESRQCWRPRVESFAPGNVTGRLMGDPPPGRTPWATP